MKLASKSRGVLCCILFWPFPAHAEHDDIVYGLQPHCNEINGSRFDICLDLKSVTGTYQPWMDAFIEAKNRWEEVIVGDLIDVSSTPLPKGNDVVCTEYPPTIDDVYICGTDDYIDGPGKVVGAALPLLIRDVGPLNPKTDKPFATAVSGLIKFDYDDIAIMRSDGHFAEAIKHEFAHILGLGPLWGLNGLYEDGTGLYKMGTRAHKEWREIGCQGRLPVELKGGPGTADGHWDEKCLRHEIMTGFVSGGQQPFSRISMGSLEDLGYTVDYEEADHFGLDDLGICGNACPAANQRTSRLGLDSSSTREISEVDMQHVISYAKLELSSLLPKVSLPETPEGVQYVGGDFMDIIYLDSKSGNLLVLPLTRKDLDDERNEGNRD